MHQCVRRVHVWLRHSNEILDGSLVDGELHNSPARLPFFQLHFTSSTFPRPSFACSLAPAAIHQPNCCNCCADLWCWLRKVEKINFYCLLGGKWYQLSAAAACVGSKNSKLNHVEAGVGTATHDDNDER